MTALAAWGALSRAPTPPSAWAPAARPVGPAGCGVRGLRAQHVRVCLSGDGAFTAAGRSRPAWERPCASRSRRPRRWDPPRRPAPRGLAPPRFPERFPGLSPRRASKGQRVGAAAWTLARAAQPAPWGSGPSAPDRRRRNPSDVSAMRLARGLCARVSVSGGTWGSGRCGSARAPGVPLLVMTEAVTPGSRPGPTLLQRPPEALGTSGTPPAAVSPRLPG